jgi:hypothetical protein
MYFNLVKRFRGKKKEMLVVGIAVVIWVIWSIWKTRNPVCFEKKIAR